MIDGLESRYKMEECSFNTISGKFEGHRIRASRKVAEKIEVQTCYAAKLYNVMSGTVHGREGPLPLRRQDESRFSPDFEVLPSTLEMQVHGDPEIPREISCVQVLDGHKRKFEGPEKKIVLAELLEFIKVHDPDVILFPYADTWVPLIVKKARRYGLDPAFSRSSRFKSMASKSYWSTARSTTRTES